MKTIRKTTGSILGLCGIAFIGISINVLLNPFSDFDPVEIKTLKINECKREVDRYLKSSDKVKVDSNISAGSITVVNPDGVSSWDRKLGVISSVLLKCEGMELERMCFGTECLDQKSGTEIDGYTFSLEYIEPSSITKE